MQAIAMDHTDPFEKMFDPLEAAPPDAPRFPIIPCIASILLTSLALVAAAANIRWGAAIPPDRTDALDAAWVYVNILLVLLWLVFWPMMALFQSQRHTLSPAEHRGRLPWQWGALAAGAIPAAIVAAFLSSLPPQRSLPMLALHAALGLLTFGALRLAIGHRIAESCAAGLLAAFALAAPLVVYFWAEFFPNASDAWFVWAPVMAASHAARDAAPSPAFWSFLFTLTLLGAALTTTSLFLPRPTTPE